LTRAKAEWQPSLVDIQEFRESLIRDTAPEGLDFALAGLWWDAKGDWAKAHESALQDEEPAGAWVHAYLHRKEGDSSNAANWYQRAHKSSCGELLQQEWIAIAEALLR
jgi:hypothetical protein